MGALVYTRKIFDELETEKLIQPLSTVTRVRNLVQEQFYAITYLGAKYVGRENDYKWRGGPKSPYNVMHESMIRDVALSFLRNYPDYVFDINYNFSYEGLKPDIVIRMFHKETMQQHIFFVEVERKKSPDRVYNEKLIRYEKVFESLNFKKHRLNAPVKVLVVYSNLDYNCFWRPQEYERADVRLEIEKLNRQLLNLVKLSKEISENRYRFLSFHRFHQLHKPIWQSTRQKSNRLI